MAQLDLKQYQTFVFDCDGVILDSNQIKTQAFYEAVKHFGHIPATKLVEFHMENGGISRYKKFEYFFTEILGKKEQKLDDVLHRFSNAVHEGLMNCEVAEGLVELRMKTKKANWMVVSGGDQAELRNVFKQRKIEKYFDGGIWGSPDAKDQIIKRELKNKNIANDAIFLGDSKYDFKVSEDFELDFIFISDWSEVRKWEEWINTNSIKQANRLANV